MCIFLRIYSIQRLIHGQQLCLSISKKHCKAINVSFMVLFIPHFDSCPYGNIAFGWAKCKFSNIHLYRINILGWGTDDLERINVNKEAKQYKASERCQRFDRCLINIESHKVLNHMPVGQWEEREKRKKYIMWDHWKHEIYKSVKEYVII